MADAVVNKFKITKLNGLHVPPIFKAAFNVEEASYDCMFNVISDDVLTSLDLAYDADLNGFVEKAETYYQAASICYYLVHLAVYVKDAFNPNNMTPKELLIDGGYGCVLDKLSCLSNKYGVDYVKIWNNLFNCTEWQNPTLLSGEFSPCEFATSEFTKPTGNSIFNNCNS